MNQSVSGENKWAGAVHLAAIVCHVTLPFQFSVPFGNVLGPLVVWLIKKDSMPLVDDNGREALNFNITMAAIGFIGSKIPFLSGTLGQLWMIVHISLVVLATVHAAAGARHRYPFAIRIFK